jgi:transposase-like protein
MKKKRDQTIEILGFMAEAISVFRKLHQAHQIGVTGFTMQCTCPFCGAGDFNVNFRTQRGRCGTCRKELLNFRDYERYYLIYLEQKENRIARRHDSFRRMMERPGDIIYKR